MAVGLGLTTFSTVFDLLFVLRVNEWMGIPDMVFLLLSNNFEDFMQTRYIFIASGVINARITPKNIEATVYSLFTA